MAPALSTRAVSVPFCSRIGLTFMFFISFAYYSQFLVLNFIFPSWMFFLFLVEVRGSQVRSPSSTRAPSGWPARDALVRAADGHAAVVVAVGL